MQVFISHSYKDKKIAKELSSRLSAAGVNIWLAEEEILPGENFSLEVGKALERSEAIVILLSPDAVGSSNVRSEIAYALSSPKFEGRVVPVVIKPTTGIPWFLRTFPMLHLRGAQSQSIREIAEKVVESLTENAKSERVVERVLGRPKAAH